VIPTMIIIGLVVGFLPRPWSLIGLAIAAVAWPLLLISSGVMGSSDTENILGGLAVATVNATAGLVIARALIALVRAKHRE
jgi:uncharacterized membrane protein YphA (DoxX/SURF4 family)